MGNVVAFDNVVFPLGGRSERDWNEDFDKWYINKCLSCEQMFNGHKSRYYCKQCFFCERKRAGTCGCTAFCGTWLESQK